MKDKNITHNFLVCSKEYFHGNIETVHNSGISP